MNTRGVSYGEATSKSLQKCGVSYGEATSKSLQKCGVSYGEATSKSLHQSINHSCLSRFVVSEATWKSPLHSLRILIPFLLIVISFSVSAQVVQKGKVLEYKGSSSKTPLSGVSINVRNANSAVSDKNGNFALTFNTLKNGARVENCKLTKSGYEVFNRDALKQWNISDVNGFTIVMCKSSQLRKYKEECEAIASKSYKSQRDNALQQAEKLLKINKLNEQEYKKRIREIEEEYERQKKSISSFVNQFAYIDLSEMNSIESEAIELLYGGNIEAAKAKYEELDPIGKLISNTSDLKKIVEAKDTIIHSEKIKKAERDSIRNVARRKFAVDRLVGTAEVNKEISAHYRDVAEMDKALGCEDIDWLMEAAEFILMFNVDKSTPIDYCKRVVAVGIQAPDRYADKIVKAYLLMGEIVGQNDQIAQSYEYYMNAEKIIEEYEVEDIVLNARLNKDLGLYHQTLDNFPLSFQYLNKAVTDLESDDTDSDENRELLADLYCDLASYSFTIGKNEDGKKYINQCDEILAELKRPFPQAVIMNYINLARYEFESGNLDEGLRKFDDVIDLIGLVYPDNLISAGMVCFIQGNKNILLNRPMDAITDLRQSIQSFEAFYDTPNSMLAAIYLQLGDQYLSMKEYEKAYDAFMKAENINEEIFGSDHSEMIDVYDSLANLYIELSYFESALLYLEKELEICESKFSPNHPTLINIYNSMGNIKGNQGEFDLQRIYYEKAGDICKAIYDEKSIKVAHYYLNIGEVELNVGNFEKAKNDFEKALQLFIPFWGEMSTSLAVCHSKLGNVYQNLNDYAKAESHYLKSIELLEQSAIKNPEELASCYWYAAQFYLFQNLISQAEMYYEKIFDAAECMEDFIDRIPYYSLILEDYLNIEDYDTTLIYCDKIITIIELQNESHLYDAVLYELGEIKKSLVNWKNVAY